MWAARRCLLRSSLRTRHLVCIETLENCSGGITPKSRLLPSFTARRTATIIRRDSWPGIPQRVDPSASTGVAVAPRYELQYGYDKHARWRGHWVREYAAGNGLGSLSRAGLGLDQVRKALVHEYTSG